MIQARVLTITGMTFLLGLLIGVGAGWLVASKGSHDARTSDNAATERHRYEIAPTDFALIPCDGPASYSPCAILAAGGKRVLIGAPAGIGAGYVTGERIIPDAVILPVLAADWIEGLDEVRNASWAGGRQVRLAVRGGPGVEEIVDGLNAAYVIPDALAYLQNKATGSFDAALLLAEAVQSGGVAFDTGDLRIEAIEAGPDVLALQIYYGGQSVLLLPCEIPDPEQALQRNTTHIVACTDSAGLGDVTSSWPPDEAVFFNR